MFDLHRFRFKLLEYKCLCLREGARVTYRMYTLSCLPVLPRRFHLSSVSCSTPRARRIKLNRRARSRGSNLNDKYSLDLPRFRFPRRSRQHALSQSFIVNFYLSPPSVSFSPFSFSPDERESTSSCVTIIRADAQYRYGRPFARIITSGACNLVLPLRPSRASSFSVPFSSPSLCRESRAREETRHDLI